MAQYDALEAYLRRRGDEEIELDLAEVERIIGSELPPSASRPQWWANASSDNSSHGQDGAWYNAGYDAFLLPRNRLLFRRRPG